MLETISKELLEEAKKFEEEMSDEDKAEYKKIQEENEKMVSEGLKQTKDGVYTKSELSFKISMKYNNKFNMTSLEHIVFTTADIISNIKDAGRVLENITCNNMENDDVKVTFIMSTIVE